MGEENNVLPLSTVPEVNDMLSDVIRQGAKNAHDSRRSRSE